MTKLVQSNRLLDKLLTALNEKTVTYTGAKNDPSGSPLLTFTTTNKPTLDITRNSSGEIVIRENGSIPRAFTPIAEDDCPISDLGFRLLELASPQDLNEHTMPARTEHSPEQRKTELLTLVEDILRDPNSSVVANTYQLDGNDEDYPNYTLFEIQRDEVISIKIFPGVDNLDKMRKLTICIGNTTEEEYGLYDTDIEPIRLKELVSSLLVKSLRSPPPAELANIKSPSLKPIAEQFEVIANQLTTPHPQIILPTIDASGESLKGAVELITDLNNSLQVARDNRDSAFTELELAKADERGFEFIEKGLLKSIKKLSESIYGSRWGGGLLKTLKTLETSINTYQRQQSYWQSRRDNIESAQEETQQRTATRRGKLELQLDRNDQKAAGYGEFLTDLNTRIKADLNKALDGLKDSIEHFRDSLTERAPAGTILGKISRTATNLFLSGLAGKYSFWALAAGVVGATYAVMTASSWLFSLLGL